MSDRAPQAESQHEWAPADHVIRWKHCRACLVIRRADGKNGPCKGPGRIGLRRVRVDENGRKTWDEQHACPACWVYQGDVMFEEPHFRCTRSWPPNTAGGMEYGGHVEGIQTCTECGFEWELSD